MKFIHFRMSRDVAQVMKFIEKLSLFSSLTFLRRVLRLIFFLHFGREFFGIFECFRTQNTITDVAREFLCSRWDFLWRHAAFDGARRARVWVDRASLSFPKEFFDFTLKTFHREFKESFNKISLNFNDFLILFVKFLFFAIFSLFSNFFHSFLHFSSLNFLNF